MSAEAKIKAYFEETSRNIVAWQIQNAADGLVHKRSQFWGRIGGNPGERSVNPLNYDALWAFAELVRRQDDALKRQGQQWIALHVEDTVEAANRGFDIEGRPPGEYTLIQDDGTFLPGDTDIHRHVGMTGLCDAARDPELVAVGVPVDRVKALARRWGQWLLDGLTAAYGWAQQHRHKRRFALPILSAVAIYELLQDEDDAFPQQMLEFAHIMLVRGWHGALSRRIEGRGEMFTKWDTGHPDDWDWDMRGWGKADVSSWPWYSGNEGHAFMRLWPHAKPWARRMIADVVMSESDWIAKRALAPTNTTDRPAPFLNSVLHGGMPASEPGPLSRPGSAFLDYQMWSDLIDGDADYRRHMALEVHETVPGYSQASFNARDGKITREHHYGKLDGPWLRAAGSAWGIVPMQLCRWLITRKPEDWNLTVMLGTDYCAYANYSSTSQLLRWSQRDTKVMTSNTGPSRSAAWWMLSMAVWTRFFLGQGDNRTMAGS